MDLLRAEYIGVRTLKTHLSKYLRGDRPVVVTERGRPKRVILGYNDAVDLIEMMEEARDSEWTAEVERSRRAYRKGGGVPFRGGSLRRRVGLGR